MEVKGTISVCWVGMSLNFIPFMISSISIFFFFVSHEFPAFLGGFSRLWIFSWSLISCLNLFMAILSHFALVPMLPFDCSNSPLPHVKFPDIFPAYSPSFPFTGVTKPSSFCLMCGTCFCPPTCCPSLTKPCLLMSPFFPKKWSLEELAVFPKRTQQCRAQWHEHFPLSTGKILPETSQNCISFHTCASHQHHGSSCHQAPNQVSSSCAPHHKARCCLTILDFASFSGHKPLYLWPSSECPAPHF